MTHYLQRKEKEDFVTAKPKPKPMKKQKRSVFQTPRDSHESSVVSDNDHLSPNITLFDQPEESSQD